MESYTAHHRVLIRNDQLDICHEMLNRVALLCAQMGMTNRKLL